MISPEIVREDQTIEERPIFAHDQNYDPFAVAGQIIRWHDSFRFDDPGTDLVNLLYARRRLSSALWEISEVMAEQKRRELGYKFQRDRTKNKLMEALRPHHSSKADTEIAAENDPKYIEFLRLSKEAESHYTRARALKEAVEKKVDALSKEITFQEEQYKRINFTQQT